MFVQSCQQNPPSKPKFGEIVVTTINISNTKTLGATVVKNFYRTLGTVHKHL